MRQELMEKKAEDRQRKYQKEWCEKNKEHLRKYRKEWALKHKKRLKKYRQEWGLINKIRLTELAKIWHQKNKKHKREVVNKRFKEFPWLRFYWGARSRCYPSCQYGKRGIKFLLTVEETKLLWFRDKADLMIRPSIDRIKTEGNYTLDNSRFIELKENLNRVKYKPAKRGKYERRKK